MKREDFAAFSAVIVGFTEIRGRQLSAPAIELYWRTMQHWELEDFKRAAEYLLRSCEFMPTPKDFEDLRKAGRLTPGEAWAQVLEWARGRAEKPTDPNVLAAVQAIGGIGAIQMSQIDRTHFLERRFCEHYESIEDRGDVRAALPKVAHLALLPRRS